MRDKPIVAIGIIVVAVVVSAWLLLRGGQRASQPPQRWFYNLETGKLEAHAISETSTTTLPSGAQGVQASVFACNDCNDPSQRFVYLERSNAPSGPPQPRPDGLQTGGPSREMAMMAEPDALEWVPFDSAAGQQIIRAMQSHCPGGTTAKLCKPDQ